LPHRTQYHYTSRVRSLFSPVGFKQCMSSISNVLLRFADIVYLFILLCISHLILSHTSVYDSAARSIIVCRKGTLHFPWASIPHIMLIQMVVFKKHTSTTISVKFSRDLGPYFSFQKGWLTLNTFSVIWKIKISTNICQILSYSDNTFCSKIQRPKERDWGILSEKN